MKIGRTDKRGFVVKVNRVRDVRGHRVRSRNVHGLTGFDKGNTSCVPGTGTGEDTCIMHTRLVQIRTYVQYIYFASRTLTP